VAKIGYYHYSLAMRDIDHEFSLIRTDRRVVPSGRLWNPAADVFKTAKGWIVKVDLAGVCSDELEIKLHDSLLTISGCRRDTHIHDGCVYHQMEITYSRFEKSIHFPAPIEGASIRRDYKDGFLIIDVRKEQD
jgi:HSP20 family protein